MLYNPYNYQTFAEEHAVTHLNCGLFLDMGLGKTVVMLTVGNRLMYQEMDVKKMLVIAPKQVARTVWKQEAAKWDHLKHLKVSIIWGTPQERIAALRAKADVYVINRENVVWLVSQVQSGWPFDMVVVDESSSFKSHAALRFRHLKMMKKYIKRMVILTGTPAPNGLIDLWSQIYLLDEGERLGKTISGYRERYFAAERIEGYVNAYRIRKGSETAIHSKIQDICISMKGRDYLEREEVIENTIGVELSGRDQKRYDDFEEEQVMQMYGPNGHIEITALNAGALSTKLLQFANGAIYHEGKEPGSRTWTEIHTVKLEALADIIEAAQGNPVLVFYTFQHDMERISRRFTVRRLKTETDINDWNAGRIKVMIAHPASAGHGLNLQAGGHLLTWFGQTWSLELDLQAKARLDRQGQLYTVIMNRIVTLNTIDQDVVRALTLKAEGQNALMEAIRARVNKYIK